MNFVIRYGNPQISLDVTQLTFDKCMKNNVIRIPRGQAQKNALFTDPDKDQVKVINIYNLLTHCLSVHDDSKDVYIDLNTNSVFDLDEYEDKLFSIQKMLKIEYGSFSDEHPEQLMAVRNLKGTEKVLEIGGNIGRNSLIIASILKTHGGQLVSIECDQAIALQLKYNRDLNGLEFAVEASALSNRKLIQHKWNTIESEVLLEGYTPVSSISYAELTRKYNIAFDTLVLDCEGAFYYILKDTPEILDNINLIIIENDFVDLADKHYVNEVLESRGFKVVYTEALSVPTPLPCQENFFEVWKK
jgi:FkbM family methyltransferase